MVKVNKFMCCGGDSTDAIKYYRDEMKRLGDEIEQTLRDDELDNYTRVALITFTTKQRAYEVQQLVLEERLQQLDVSPAPPPQDVLYDNMHISPSQRKIRFVVVLSACCSVQLIFTHHRWQLCRCC